MEVWSDKKGSEKGWRRWFTEKTSGLAGRRREEVAARLSRDLHDLHQQCDRLRRRMESARRN